MTTTSVEHVDPQKARRRPSILSYYIRCEILKLLRIPTFTVPTLLLPIMFFGFFGLPSAGTQVGNVDAAAYMLASYGAYAVMAVALFSFGVAIAAERGLGWNKLLRTTPLNPLTFFAAKIVMALVFGLFTLLLLFTFGGIAANVQLSALVWTQLVTLLLMGMIPFVALGLAIGYFAGPNSAAAVANLIFMPLSFASGLFIPVQFLPTVVQQIAPYMPAYHVGQLGWTVLKAGDGSGLGVHMLWIAGYTVVFLILALVAYRRDEGKNFG